jgi:hypothetical protein
LDGKRGAIKHFQIFLIAAGKKPMKANMAVEEDAGKYTSKEELCTRNMLAVYCGFLLNHGVIEGEVTPGVYAASTAKQKLSNVKNAIEDVYGPRCFELNDPSGTQPGASNQGDWYHVVITSLEKHFTRRAYDNGTPAFVCVRMCVCVCEKMITAQSKNYGINQNKPSNPRI